MPHVSHMDASGNSRGGGRIAGLCRRVELDLAENEFVAAEKFGLPIPAGATRQAIDRSDALASAATAADTHAAAFDVEFGSFRRRAGASDGIGLRDEIRFDARKRADRDRDAPNAGVMATRQRLEFGDEGETNGKLMHERLPARA